MCRTTVVLASAILVCYCLFAVPVMAEGIRGIGWMWDSSPNEIKRIERTEGGRLIADIPHPDNTAYRVLIYEIDAFGVNMDVTYRFNGPVLSSVYLIHRSTPILTDALNDRFTDRLANLYGVKVVTDSKTENQYGMRIRTFETATTRYQWGNSEVTIGNPAPYTSMTITPIEPGPTDQ